MTLNLIRIIISKSSRICKFEINLLFLNNI